MKLKLEFYLLVLCIWCVAGCQTDKMPTGQGNDSKSSAQSQPQPDYTLDSRMNVSFLAYQDALTIITNIKLQSLVPDMDTQDNLHWLADNEIYLFAYSPFDVEPNLPFGEFIKEKYPKQIYSYSIEPSLSGVSTANVEDDDPVVLIKDRDQLLFSVTLSGDVISTGSPKSPDQDDIDTWISITLEGQQESGND